MHARHCALALAPCHARVCARASARESAAHSQVCVCVCGLRAAGCVLGEAEERVRERRRLFPTEHALLVAATAAQCRALPSAGAGARHAVHPLHRACTHAESHARGSARRVSRVAVCDAIQQNSAHAPAMLHRRRAASPASVNHRAGGRKEGGTRVLTVGGWAGGREGLGCCSCYRAS